MYRPVGGGARRSVPAPPYFLGINFKKEDHHFTIENTELINVLLGLIFLRALSLSNSFLQA